jgi:hypothetical protein
MAGRYNGSASQVGMAAQERAEVSRCVLHMVRFVMRTGGYDLSAHKRVKRVLAALRNEKSFDGRVSELQLAQAAANYLCDRSLRLVPRDPALETIRG